MKPHLTVVPDAYVWMLLASFQLGLTNMIGHGRWHPTAFVLLLMTAFLLAWRFFLRERLIRQDVVVVVVFVLLLSLPITALLQSQIITHPHPARSIRWIPWLRLMEVASIGLTASYLPFLGLSRSKAEPEALKTARFLGFGLVVIAIGVIVIHLAPSPPIDVWTIQTRGAEVLLLEGKNPYVWATVPDTDPENEFVVPYVYPPTALYASIAGFVLGKDVRVAMVFAVVIAGVAMRFVARTTHAGSQHYRQPSLLEDAPALFFWQTPMLVIVLELSWIDPLQLMFISLAVAAEVGKGPPKRKLLAAVLIGLAVSSKQSMFWLLPLAGVLMGYDKKRWIAMTLAALLPWIPFMIWDAPALKHACFDFLSGLPPRRDALCFTNAVWQWFHLAFPGSSAFFLAAVVVLVLVRRKKPRVDFSLAVLLTYFVFFFFNRWAFANYFFLLTGLAALAAAASCTTRARLVDNRREEDAGSHPHRLGHESFGARLSRRADGSRVA